MMMIMMMISNGNWTERNAIQGLIGRVIFFFYEHTRSHYQLIVLITKVEVRKSERNSF